MARKKTARPTLPNAGIEAAYRRKLTAIIDSMDKDISNSVEGEYLSALKGSNPTKKLTSLINRRMVKWNNAFDGDSVKLAEWFKNRSDSHVRSSLGRSLAKAANVSIKFKTTEKVENVLDDIVFENVDLIKSIPRQYHEQVNKEVSESVNAGRDIGGLKDKLHRRYGITKERARMIARDQNNKATETIGLARNISLGITEGIWMHRAGSKQPRSSHQRASGQKFDLKKGLLIDGEYILPGEKVNCNCTFKPVIPGYG